MAETKVQARQRWARENKLMAQRKVSGDWPAFECEACVRKGYGKKIGTRYILGPSACCKSWGHHVGDCCTHCGNDERGLRC